MGIMGPDCLLFTLVLVNDQESIRFFLCRDKEKRPVSPNREEGHAPARHRPGARSARWEWCLSVVSQTKRSDVMKRYSSTASLVLALAVVLKFAGPVLAGELKPFKGPLSVEYTL